MAVINLIINLHDKTCKVCSYCCATVGIYKYTCTWIVMLSVNLCVGRGKFEMLDDQIQGTCTARKCKKTQQKTKTNKQTNKRTKNEKKNKTTTTTNPNSVSILTKYCFKNWDVDLLYSVRVQIVGLLECYTMYIYVTHLRKITKGTKNASSPIRDRINWIYTYVHGKHYSYKNRHNCALNYYSYINVI